jgi:hypothetical protein
VLEYASRESRDSSLFVLGISRPEGFLLTRPIPLDDLPLSNLLGTLTALVLYSSYQSRVPERNDWLDIKVTSGGRFAGHVTFFIQVMASEISALTDRASHRSCLRIFDTTLP